MKRKLVGILVFAFASVMTFCLVGCGTALDREVTIQNMTISVPSGWAEDSDEYSLGTTSYGSYSYVSDDMESSISIHYSNDYTTPEEDLASMERSYASDPINAYDWYVNDLGQEAIESSVVSKYEYGYKAKDNDGNEWEGETQIAYIMTPSLNFDIAVIGDEVKLDDVLKTMKIA